MAKYKNRRKLFNDLNRHYHLSKSKNTVLAKVIIDSNKTQKKKLYIGYSDKIRIYLNTENIFSGNNSFHESDKYEDRGYVLDKHQIDPFTIPRPQVV